MEARLISKALEGLIAAGPVAVVLGLMCYFLWKQNQDLLKELRSDKKRMILIAMRVTKAVEVLAGIEQLDESGLDEVDEDE